MVNILEEQDALRQLYLETVYKLTFLRFSNGEVIQHMDAVIERIGNTLLDLTGLNS